MKSIRIKNMRSLKDTGTINLKPINILVGNNSSGKSTFLRTFPLFKQSFSRRIDGLILWAGDDADYVDFGSFKETLNKEAKGEDIVFEFETNIDVKNIMHEMNRYSLFKSKDKKYSINKQAKLRLCINNNGKKDFVSNFFVECNGKSIQIDNIENRVYYNQKLIDLDDLGEIGGKEKQEMVLKRYGINRNSLYSIINEKFTFDLALDIIKGKLLKDKLLKDTYFRLIEKEFMSKLCADAFLDNSIDSNAFVKEFKEDMIKSNKDVPSSMIDQINIEIDKKVIEKEIVLDFLNVIFLNMIATNSFDYIYQYFLNVNYIKPVRAHAERYYRLKNLAVDEIDPDGKNLPMFINSLSEKDLKQYNSWLMENFGFKVEPKLTDGHVSMNIKIAKQKSVNLSDSGYGYSQLLPIVTQLWIATIMKKENTTIVFAIEQLELHLHPEMQARLMDVITKIVKLKKEKIQFILETHSETIINRLGNLIYKGKVLAEDVNIILFNKEVTDSNTEIKTSNFNEEGYLENWPIGFFGVDDIE